MSLLRQVLKVRASLAETIELTRKMEIEAEEKQRNGQKVGPFIGIDSELSVRHLGDLDLGIKTKNPDVILRVLNMISSYGREYSPEVMSWSGVWENGHAVFDSLLSLTADLLFSEKLFHRRPELHRELQELPSLKT